MNKKELPPVILMDCEIRSIEGVISTFGKRGIEVIALTSSKNDLPPAFKSKFVQHSYISPQVLEEQDYLQFLLGLPFRGVLVYSSDSGAEFVSKHKAALQEAGYLINIPDIDTFRRGFNKDQIFKVCAESGVPTMKTKVVRSVDDIYAAHKEIGLPLILKPTRLAGGKYWKIREEKEIEPAYQAMMDLIRSSDHAAQQSELIVQEFIEHHYDELYCCEYYYSKDHQSRDFLTIRKVRPNINYDGTAGSRLYAGKTVSCKEIEQLSERLLDHLNWNGFAHLDWLYSKKHQSYLLCEINPRLPGFSNFITAIGFEMAWYYYADLTGLTPPPFRFKRALYFEALRHPGDLTTNLLAVLKGHLNFWSYVRSYLMVLNPRNKVVFDVFYGSDLKMTWENYKISLRNLRRKITSD